MQNTTFMIVQTKKTTLFKSVILPLIIAGFILSVTSCSDGSNKFIGKHTISIPLYTTKNDTSVDILEYGSIVHPKVNYYDLYTTKIDIYKTGDNLEGKLNHVYPESGKWFVTESKIKEQTLELKSLHIEKDTLMFLIDYGPMSPKFDGCAYIDDGNMVVGLPKKLFKWIEKNHCTETAFKDNQEFFFFVTDRQPDKKALYKCQADSLQEFIKANPKYNKRYELDINFLNKISK